MRFIITEAKSEHLSDLWILPCHLYASESLSGLFAQSILHSTWCLEKAEPINHCKTKVLILEVASWLSIFECEMGFTFRESHYFVLGRTFQVVSFWLESLL